MNIDNPSLDDLLTISQIVGTFIAGVALLAIWFQFKLDKQLNEADFLIRLNLNFIENSSFSGIYSTLEKNRVEKQKLNPFNEEDIIDMANYLTYFEPFYTLIQQGILKIEKLDPVLSYRFFLATNNKYMQEMLLVKKPGAFRNIYLLHLIWRNYRIKMNKRKGEDYEIIQDNFCLSKSKDYSKYSKNES